MYNFMKMDIRRMLRSRSMQVSLLIVVLWMFLGFGIMYGVANPQAREKIAAAGVTLTITNQEALETMDQISILEIMDQSGVRGGMFACVTGVLAAIFLCGEYECGFIKNVFAVCENKWKFVLSKLGCLCLVNLIFLFAMYLASICLNIVTGSFFQWNTPEGTVLYLASAWMLQNAFSALYLLVSILTRSKAAGVAAGILFGSGTVVVLLSTVLGVLDMNKFLDYTIYFALNRCPMTYEKPADFGPLLTGVVFVAVYTGMGKLAAQRKDI